MISLGCIWKKYFEIMCLCMCKSVQLHIHCMHLWYAYQLSTEYLLIILHAFSCTTYSSETTNKTQELIIHRYSIVNIKQNECVVHENACGIISKYCVSSGYSEWVCLKWWIESIKFECTKLLTLSSLYSNWRRSWECFKTLNLSVLRLQCTRYPDTWLLCENV